MGQIKSEDLNQILEKVRVKFKLPAVTLTVLNSDEIYLTEVQGVEYMERIMKYQLTIIFTLVPVLSRYLPLLPQS